MELNEQIWWHTARAGGIVAWALLTLAVVWGMLAHTRLLEGRPKPAWILDLHRFLGALAVVFTAFHVIGLVADSYVHFGWSEVLVPLASAWEPGAVALGVVAAYLLVTVEVTSLVQRRIPRTLWRVMHLTSYLTFWAASLHGALAGTDAGHPAFVAANVVAVLLVTFLSLVRIVGGRVGRRSGARPPRVPREEREPAGVS